VGYVKVLLAVLAIAAIAAFIVTRPEEGEALGGKGTASADAGRLGSRCTVFADQPVVARDGTVTATGRFRCAKSDGGVDTNVYLQFNDAGRWTTVDHQPMGATGADATRKRPEQDRTVRVAGDCTPGSYRTFVRGTVSNGDKGYPVEAITKPKTVACAAPPSGS
jgi:hypothetical protein